MKQKSPNRSNFQF